MRNSIIKRALNHYGQGVLREFEYYLDDLNYLANKTL